MLYMSISISVQIILAPADYYAATLPLAFLFIFGTSWWIRWWISCLRILVDFHWFGVDFLGCLMIFVCFCWFLLLLLWMFVDFWRFLLIFGGFSKKVLSVTCFYLLLFYFYWGAWSWPCWIPMQQDYDYFYCFFHWRAPLERRGGQDYNYVDYFFFHGLHLRKYPPHLRFVILGGQFVVFFNSFLYFLIMTITIPFFRDLNLNP